MSRDWSSRVLTVVLVVLMVTSSIAPVAAAGSSSYPTTAQAGSDTQFDFSALASDSSADASAQTGDSSAKLSPSAVQPSVTLPSYARADLADISVSLGTPSSNANGALNVPVTVKGTYENGQYPWRIPVTVTVTSGDLKESTIVYLAPGRGSDDYRSRAQLTLQFVQDGSTSHTIDATVISQVGDRDSDSTSRSYDVAGASDQSTVTTTGQIRNDDVSEPPNEVGHVTRYRATERADSYLEDSSIPVGTESTVKNFAYIRDSNNQHAVFQSYRGDMAIGTLTTGVPNGSAQTLVIRYRALEGEDVAVTPVDSSGFKIDRDYILPADPDDDPRCHAGDGEKADICIFRLSDTESDNIGRQNELILNYHTKQDTAIAMFCQDVVTGGMPEDGSVCGIGAVNTYSDVSIESMYARGAGNSAGEQETLYVDGGTDITISVELKNSGDGPQSGTLTLASSDTKNFSTPTTREFSLLGGETTTLDFNVGEIDAQIVRFEASFEDSTEWVRVSPNGLADSVNPVAVPSGPYIVPLEVSGENKVLLGMQQQTLSERPGSEWTQVRRVGSSGGTDDWTTSVSRIPVIGSLNAMEAASDNITYINNQLASTQGAGVTVEDAYADALNDASRQLPAATSVSDWELTDIQYTTSITTNRKISPDRPDGYGWEKIDKYGSVETGDFEVAQFRYIGNGSVASSSDLVVDAEGAGWVKMNGIPPEYKLETYRYENSSTDPDVDEVDDANDGVNDWERYQYVETRRVANDRAEWDVRHQDSRYDPGGEWRFVQELQNGQFEYIRPTYDTEEVWTWRKPVRVPYYTFERPITETTYEWERTVYDAKFVFERTATTNSEFLWEGPKYVWTDEYNSEEAPLNGSRSFDRGPVGQTGISKYLWEFEDRTTATTAEHDRPYTVPFGVYEPSLTVTDNFGNTDTDTAEVHVIPEPLICRTVPDAPECSPTDTVPSIQTEATRDPVAWLSEPVSFETTLSGYLHEREWVVNVTADEYPSFSKEIWRSYDIVDGEETIHSTISPKRHDIQPGEVEFAVTATPAGESYPAVSDTFSVYLCNPTMNGFAPSEEGCDSLDSDGDGYTDGDDDKDDEQDPERVPDGPNTGAYSISYEHAAVWNSVADWDDVRSGQHLTLVGGDDEHDDAREGTLRIGYERDSEIRDGQYKNLLVYYGLERDPIRFAETDSDAWSIDDDADDEEYVAQIFADKNPGDNGGDFQRAVDGAATGEDYTSRAPQFGTSGVFGSRGVAYTDETYGFIEIVSPTNVRNNHPRPGDRLSEELDDDYTVSWWAKGSPVTRYEDGQLDQYQDYHWQMSSRTDVLGTNRGNIPVASLYTRWESWTSLGTFSSTTTCFPEGLQFSQRWHSQSTDATDVYSSESDGVSGIEETPDDPDCDRTRRVDNPDGIEQMTDGEWHHYAWVVNGGNGGDETLTLYVDGQAVYSRTFADLNGASSDTNSFWTINNGRDGVEMNRFIWGGAWNHYSGLTKVQHNAQYDEIRLYNKALSEEEVQKNEYLGDVNDPMVEGTGIREMNSKFLNASTEESYETADMEVELQGTIENGQEVAVTVIPWVQDGSGEWIPAPSGTEDTVYFTGRADTREVFLGVDETSRVSIRVQAITENAGDSPLITQVAVLSNVTVEKTVPNDPPRAYLSSSSSLTVPAGTTTRLVGSGSTDDDGHIASYQYLVEAPDAADTRGDVDSVSSGDQIPDFQYTFSCAGTYQASLKVTDDLGGTDTMTREFIVTNALPTADATPNEQVIQPGETATFDASGSSDSDGQVKSYDWHFENDDSHQYGASASKSYSSPGTYWVTLTVGDNACGEATERVKVIVQNDAPTADAGVDQSVVAGDTVQFDGMGSSDPSGDSLSYEWDFDADGSYDVTGATPTYVFDSAGTKTVTLRVSDPYGSTDTDTMNVEVSASTAGTVIVGETGTMSVSADDGSWQTLSFENSYENPVVIAKPIDTSGPTPAHIRVRDVQSDSARLQVEEWEYKDGSHSTVTAHYVVMEEGVQMLADGTQVVVGSQSVGTTGAGITFAESFSSTPVVFSQSQTRNSADAIVTRNSNVDTNGFSTYIQEEERLGPHYDEQVGYIAIEQGEGTVDGIAFEAYSECCFEESMTRLDFIGSYSTDRNIVLDMQTADGGDPAGIRWESFTSGGIDLFIEEEQSDDSETAHAPETVGYWVFDRDGDIRAVGGGTVYETTFDSNDGWSLSSTSGDIAEITNGELHLAQEQCGETTAIQSLGTHSGDLTVAFDWTTQTDQWWEDAHYAIYVDGSNVYEDGMQMGKGTTKSGHIEQTLSVNGDVEIRFGTRGSSSCGAGDHEWTHFYVDNLSVTK